MATRINNDHYGVLIEDDGYGIQQLDLTAGIPFPVHIDIKPVITTADNTEKTLTFEPKVEERKKTGGACLVTMTGELASEYQVLLDAWSENTEGNNYVIPEVQPAGFTYNIYRLYPGTALFYDVALGCKCTGLTIDTQTSGVVKFTATFEGRSFRRGIESDNADELTNVPANIVPTVFRHADIVTSNVFGISNVAISSLNLALTKTLADANVSHQNNELKIQEVVTGYSGQLSISKIYDEANDSALEADIEGTQSISEFALVNSDATWTFEVTTKTTNIDLPDDGKGLVMATITADMAGTSDAANDSIIVTIS